MHALGRSLTFFSVLLTGFQTSSGSRLAVHGSLPGDAAAPWSKLVLVLFRD